MQNKKRIARLEKTLGYTQDDLKKHLESFPEFEAIKHNFNIDHIFSVWCLNRLKCFSPKIINSLENLRPMNPQENTKKGHTCNFKLAKRWLTKKKREINESNKAKKRFNIEGTDKGGKI